MTQDRNRRVIDVSRIFQVIVGKGEIYDSLNQNGVLDSFGTFYPSTPATVTVVYFYFENDPINMKVDIDTFKALVKEEVRYTRNQFCGQLMEPFSIDKVLPMIGSTIPILDLAHLAMHILLYYAVRCREPRDVGEKDDFPYKEVVYRNINNPSHEAIGAFNFPARSAHVAIMGDLIADFLHLWTQGISTDTFQKVMHAQTIANDQSRLRT